MQRHPFALEHLEGRAYFSFVTPGGIEPITAGPVLEASAQAATTTVKVFPHSFNVAGTFTHPMVGPIGIGNPDTGSQYHFVGVGKTDLLGNFRLTGNVQLPGFINNASANGTLVIRAPKGNIYMSVVGPPQAPGSLPTSFTFQVYRGTGAYVHAVGKGTIGVSASDTTMKFLFRFRPKT